MTKIACFSRPHALDNRDLVCPHGKPAFAIPLLGDEKAAVVTTKVSISNQELIYGVRFMRSFVMCDRAGLDFSRYLEAVLRFRILLQRR